MLLTNVYVVLAVSTLTLASSLKALITSRASIPSCLTTCLASADFGSCSTTDETCLCEDSDFVTGLISCAIDSCPTSTVDSALSSAESLWAAVGVDVETYLPSSYLASITASSVSSATSTASATASSESDSAVSINSPLGLAMLIIPLIFMAM
ncbi:hypothetical protein FISHEDRAFT_77909 [Fistulina hepatica ATCC 64428]|nr:hypothetical protein FISHEDRAFT_77909 [Fistulina hepatica ATCC 64428]